MKDADNIDHAWIQERLAAAIAGGLSPQEQMQFDAHINACPACFDAFTDARDADRTLQRNLSGLTPSADFEKNLLTVIREKTMHKRFPPLIKRAGMGIAAAVALAATGVFANIVIQQDTFNNPMTERLASSADKIPLPSVFPELAKARELANRSSAAASIRGILKADVETTAAIKSSFGWNPDSSKSDDFGGGRAGEGAARFYDYPELGEKDAKRSGVRITEYNGQAKYDTSASDGERDRGKGDKLVTQNAEWRGNNESTTELRFAQQSIRKLQEELGRLQQSGGGQSTGDTTVTVAGDKPVDVAAAQSGRFLTGAGISASSGAVVQMGSGNITLSGSGTYSGGTTVNGGTLGVQGQNEKGGVNLALGHNAITNGTIDLGGATVKTGGVSLYFKPMNSGWVEGGYTYDHKKSVAKDESNSIRGSLYAETDVAEARIRGGLHELSEKEKNLPGKDRDKVARNDPSRPVSGQGGSQVTSTWNSQGPGVDGQNVGFGDGFVDYVAQGNPAPPPAGGGAAVQNPPAQAPEVSVRKVIRNGEVEFEVRSFDDAYQTIAAVTEEEKGYVSSTSSEKLANGKIRGSVVVRVPPERLDRMLLKLRALGELKSQQIAANDVSKQYTDIESELKALRAMEGRLIDLVKNGKGEVKDLVVAEKQLGEYRVRIEKLEGEIRYYNNLVGMATLTITAFEKDIQKPTAASEQENVTLSLETEDVETKYRDARKILEEAKGRIVESELKKYDADQYRARIVVDVPPDKADFVAAQLKQIGKVATYNRDRKQTATGGTGAPTVQVEQKDTRFTIALFNLANVAPRETAVLTVAVRDVEASYRKVLGLVRQTLPAKPEAKEGPAQLTGRVVTSNINGQQPDQMTADIRADVRAEQADQVLAAIRETGEVVTSTSSENPDTANVTSAKRGIQLRLVNAAAVPARESRSMRIVAANVPEAYGKLLGSLQEQGGNVRIMTSQLNETDPRTISAALSFEARRESLPAIEKAFADAGIDFLSRNIVRSSDTANTLDSKIRFQIDELVMADALPARRTTMLGLEVENVEKSLDSLRASLPVGAREVDFNVAKEASGRVTGHLVVDVPVASAMTVLMKIKDIGGVEKVNQVVKNNQVPETRFARERFEVALASREAIVQNDKGLGSTVRAALSTAVGALLYSVYLIIIGVLFIGPWLLIGWVLWKLARRRKVTT